MDNIDWREVGLVTLAGALGGAVSLVYSITVGNAPVVAPLPWGAPAYAVLGATAALLGVYLIAKTDTRHAYHCLVFAVACGISWAPIFDGASALVRQNRERIINAKVEEQAKEVRAIAGQLRTVPLDRLKPTATAANQRVESLFAAASETRDPKLAVSVNASVAELVESLQEVSKKDPAIAASVFKNVRKAQVAAGFSQPIGVWVSALEPRGFIAEQPRKDEGG